MGLVAGQLRCARCCREVRAMNRRTFLVLLPTGLAACAAGSGTTGPEGVPPPALRSYNVVDLDVTVPRSLVVSEADIYYPDADIVWRGDPPGDRHAQVEAIFEAGMGRGAAALDGDRDVRVAVEVRRFHSLTERARARIGGVHSIRFVLTVTDARTGAVIEGPRLVSADLPAYGGQRAREAEAAGQTQKVRVTDHLARVAVAELGDPSPTAG
jgi:hypothetical protein